MALAPAWLQAQSFDTSGTASLSGQYLFRYVHLLQRREWQPDGVLQSQRHHDLRRRRTLRGLQYATVRFGQAPRHGLLRFAGRGNVRSAIQRHRPIGQSLVYSPTTLFGTFSQAGDHRQVPPKMTSSISSSRFKRHPLHLRTACPSGSFTVGTLDFLNASASLARQGYFTLKADGQGNIAAFTVTGSLANVNSGATVTQNVAASTYALSEHHWWNHDFSRQLGQ